MSQISHVASRLLRNEDGPTAVEYAVMLSLIVAVCMGGVSLVGNNAKGSFTAASNAAGKAGSSGPAVGTSGLVMGSFDPAGGTYQTTDIHGGVFTWNSSTGNVSVVPSTTAPWSTTLAQGETPQVAASSWTRIQ